MSIRPDTPVFNTPRENVDLGYLPPHLLSLDQLRDQINERREVILDYLFNEAGFTRYEELPAFVRFGREFNISEITIWTNELADNDDNPDFRINVFVRMLYYTDEYDDILLPAIAGVPIWITPGEDNLLYWTENHHILFTSAAYLLRQKYASSFPSDYFDEGLDQRLDWILRVKQEYSLFEFGSPLYLRLTLLGLLNLYDFAEDLRIKEEAKKCILKIFRDWIEQMNSAGVACVSAGRTDQLFYYQEIDMFGRGFQQILFAATGLGPFVKYYESLKAGTVAFLLSDIDISEAVQTYSPEESFHFRSIGGRDDDLFFPLKGNDRTVIEISMGSYVHPDYINNFYNLFEDEDMLDHKILGGMGPVFRALTFPFLRRLVSTIISTISTGSLLVVPKLAIYKHDAVTLTSCQDYFPGYKGYQQMPSMAIVKNTSVFTYAMKEINFKDAEDGISQLANNNQLPKLLQKNNVLLALYNRKMDMGLLGVDGTDVIFHMDYSHYSDIVHKGKWVFGEVDSSFVGVYRECVDNSIDHVYTRCKSRTQVWITIVGNEVKYQSFQNFSDILLDSRIDISYGRGCIFFNGVIDGNFLEDSMCRSIGNALVTLLLVLLLIIFSGLGCWFCCSKRGTKLDAEKKEAKSL